MRKILFLLSIVFISQFSKAQSLQGDTLLRLINLSVSNSFVQQFFAAYEIKNTVGERYSSTQAGIDVHAKNDTLISIDLFKINTQFGGYNAQLPKGLVYGFTADEVKKKLGKPTTAYMNSGYCEYEFTAYVITCWFEAGKLSQVNLSKK